MKNTILILVLFCSVHFSFGCGNEYGYSLDGQRVHTRYLFLSERMLKFNKDDINKRLTALNNKVENGTDDYKTWSNIALNLMKLGQTDSSLKILLPLYKAYPNEYTIIGNFVLNESHVTYYRVSLIMISSTGDLITHAAII